MDIVIDTSALIAVIVDEPERNKIIKLTTGNTLIGPGSIPWEIGGLHRDSRERGMSSHPVRNLSEGRHRYRSCARFLWMIAISLRCISRRRAFSRSFSQAPW